MAYPSAMEVVDPHQHGDVNPGLVLKAVRNALAVRFGVGSGAPFFFVGLGVVWAPLFPTTLCMEGHPTVHASPSAERAIPISFS